MKNPDDFVVEEFGDKSFELLYKKYSEFKKKIIAINKSNCSPTRLAFNDILDGYLMHICEKRITFDNFGEKGCDHELGTFGSDLVCNKCGATTKIYDLTDEELRFLIKSAIFQGLLIDPNEAENEGKPRINRLFTFHG